MDGADVFRRTFSMEGQVCLVTGASSGLGLHFAEVCCQAGASWVVLAARRKEKLDHAVQKFKSARYRNCKIMSVRMDVSDLCSIRAGFDFIEERTGTVVDTLVNNAGVATDAAESTEVCEQDWDRVTGVNLKGAFFVASEAAKRMVNAQKSGVLINVSSIYGLRPAKRQVNYGAAKAGLIQVSKIMAAELLPKNIRVNCICPGYFMTEINSDFFLSAAGKEYLKRIPPRRLGQLSELTGPFLLLASKAASSFMTGTEVVVDLGHTNAAL